MSVFAKSALLAATAALALGAASAASAQAFGDPSVYIKGFGGATWPSGDDENLRSNGQRVGRVDLDYDMGYTLGLAAGFAPMENVGLEFEYAHRRADFDGEVRVGGQRAEGDGKAKANALMVNAVYTFNDMGAAAPVKPYLGVGVGAAQLDYEHDKSTWNFAYQVMGGVGYEVAPQLTLFGEGRWFSTADSKVWPEKGLATDLSFGTFDLLIGAKYQF